jgi:hypothetical protein
MSSQKGVGLAHRGDDAEARDGVLARQSEHNPNTAPGKNPQVDRRLDLFAIRCRDLRDRVMAGSLPFTTAVDMAYEAAVWSGLADDVGDDRVQAIMALAFGAVPEGVRQ